MLVMRIALVNIPTAMLIHNPKICSKILNLPGATFDAANLQFWLRVVPTEVGINTEIVSKNER